MTFGEKGGLLQKKISQQELGKLSIEKLPEEERKVIYKVIDSLLRDAKAKQAYS